MSMKSKTVEIEVYVCPDKGNEKKNDIPKCDPLLQDIKPILSPLLNNENINNPNSPFRSILSPSHTKINLARRQLTFKTCNGTYSKSDKEKTLQRSLKMLHSSPVSMTDAMSSSNSSGISYSINSCSPDRIADCDIKLDDLCDFMLDGSISSEGLSRFLSVHVLKNIIVALSFFFFF